VCFAVEGTVVAVPIDSVKPKASDELQRTKNLSADGRAVLLCDRWDRADWSRLWWVRASLDRVDTGEADRARYERLLSEKYPQYRDRPFSGLLTFRISGLTGWSGGSDPLE
jgi:hypothetical protein